MKRHSAGDGERELYREIRRAIAERRLLPGIKLTEDELASLFDVSRARVRKVLMLLAKDHIVNLEPNRGAFVCKPTVAEARQVLDARRLIERYLLAEAVKHARPAQIDKLRAILAQEAKAREEGNNPRMMRLSGEFHMALADCAQNELLGEFLSGLISRCYLILAVYQRRDARTCPQDDHTLIVDHVAAGDGAAALRVLDLHFDHIEAELDLCDAAPDQRPELRDILMRPA